MDMQGIPPMTKPPPPLSGPPPTEVPLPRAPLVRVLAQIRFPAILAIRNPDNVAIFQEAIRPNYPLLQEDRVHHVVLPTAGEPEIKEGVIWRFRSRDDDWRVSLGIDFIALETKAYHSREDFLDRFHIVVGEVESAFNPVEAQRLGIRYIDRIVAPDVNRIAELVKSEVLGVALADISRTARYIMTQTHLEAEEGDIQARWGHFPAGATFDPEAIEPIDEASWILDLDMATQQSQDFTVDGLLTTATGFAERIYTVFRWMVTDEFLRCYGGNP